MVKQWSLYLNLNMDHMGKHTPHLLLVMFKQIGFVDYNYTINFVVVGMFLTRSFSHLIVSLTLGHPLSSVIISTRSVHRSFWDQQNLTVASSSIRLSSSRFILILNDLLHGLTQMPLLITLITTLRYVNSLKKHQFGGKCYIFFTSKVVLSMIQPHHLRHVNSKESTRHVWIVIFVWFYQSNSFPFATPSFEARKFFKDSTSQVGIVIFCVFTSKVILSPMQRLCLKNANSLKLHVFGGKCYFSCVYVKRGSVPETLFFQARELF